jgi:hypothetical protein
VRLLIAILLAAAVPLASAQTIIEKAKSEQAKKSAAAAKANDQKKAEAAKAEAAKAAAAKKKAQPQSGGEKMNEMMRNKGKPPAK